MEELKGQRSKELLEHIVVSQKRLTKNLIRQDKERGRTAMVGVNEARLQALEEVGEILEGAWAEEDFFRALKKIQLQLLEARRRLPEKAPHYLERKKIYDVWIQICD